MSMKRCGAAAVAVMLASCAGAVAQPAVTEGDATLANVTFVSGERLDSVRIHYRTLGTLQRDAQGRARNAVLVLHGTGGTGAQFLQPHFANELYGPGQLLDTTKHFVILPDNIGHGKSSKPSDGLRHANYLIDFNPAMVTR